MNLLAWGGEQESFQKCVQQNKSGKCVTKVREVPRKLKFQKKRMIWDKL